MKKLLITGAGGFLASQFINKIVETGRLNSYTIAEIYALDAIDFKEQKSDTVTIHKIIGSIEDETLFHKIPKNIDIIYHFAAVVSYEAEHNFNLGMSVNIIGLLNILNFAKSQATPPFFVTTSSLAVFGGALPLVVKDDQILMPQSSYGTQKAVGELLVRDYIRKGFIKGAVLRLPTVIVRPGKPNKASSSFMSSIIREPLNNQETICPVKDTLKIWVSSFNNVVNAFFTVEKLDEIPFNNVVINVPGISVAIKEILNSLERIKGKDIVNLIKFVPDESVQNIVNTWPVEIDIARSLHLGFSVNKNIDEIIGEYMNEFL